MSLERIPSKKGRPAVLIVLLVAVIVVMIMLGKCSRPAADRPRIHPELHKSGGDTLDVAIEISPLTYRPTADTLAGLDYDMMRAICAAEGQPVNFHPFAPLKYATEGMRAGYFDVIISSLPSTAELKNRMILTDEVYRDREVLVQQPGGERHIDTPDRLAGDTVWIAADSPFSQRIANLGAEAGDSIHIVEMEGRTSEHLVMLVARGEIPRAVVYEALARRMRDTLYPDLDITTPVSFTQFQSWAVSTQALADTLNRRLERFRATPEYRELLRRYGLVN